MRVGGRPTVRDDNIIRRLHDNATTTITTASSAGTGTISGIPVQPALLGCLRSDRPRRRGLRRRNRQRGRIRSGPRLCRRSGHLRPRRDGNRIGCEPDVVNAGPEDLSECDPNYSGACVPIASEVDCEGGNGNGPAYVRGPVNVVGEDIYDLDATAMGSAASRPSSTQVWKT